MVPILYLSYLFLLVVILLVLVLEDAELPAEVLDVVDDLLLDEVEAHGDHGDAEQEVEGAEGEAYLAVLALLVGHEVAEADGGEGDEAEVAAVHQGPALPLLERVGLGDQVRHGMR